MLQLVFFKNQLRGFVGKKFLEVGPGSGTLTNAMLNYGMSGTVVEMSTISCNLLTERFADYIEDGSLKVKRSDFLSQTIDQKFDLIISSMVMEHFNNSDEKVFIQKCKDSLSINGAIMLFLPSSARHWGIEDETCGHYRRYSKEYLLDLASSFGLKVELIAGLTYPLSNLLLPISNYLVRRAESSHIKLSMHEKTMLSGHRKINGKTNYQIYFIILLNQFVLLPFIILQYTFRRNPNSLVLFFHAKID